MSNICELAAIQQTIAQLTDALSKCTAEAAAQTNDQGQDAEATLVAALNRARESAKDVAGNIEVAATIARLGRLEGVGR